MKISAGQHQPSIYTTITNLLQKERVFFIYIYFFFYYKSAEVVPHKIAMTEWYPYIILSRIPHNRLKFHKTSGPDHAYSIIMAGLCGVIQVYSTPSAWSSAHTWNPLYNRGFSLPVNSLHSGANDMYLHQYCTDFLDSSTQINYFFRNNMLMLMAKCFDDWWKK